MLLDKGLIRVTRGPKENRFRPAIDPLFRSAAYAYGPRVIGVILSGWQDDGVAGLWMIKQYGGIAVVQDPSDAEVASMPLNALKAVKVDYKVPAAEMGLLLVKLINKQLPEHAKTEKDARTEMEINIALEEAPLKNNILEYGNLTPYTCPE